MKIVLFLGAGFSAPYDLPVMNRFLAVAERSGRLTADQKALLRELTIEARQANSFLLSSPTNLEDILSFAMMGERLWGGTEEGSRLRGVRRILQRVYTEVGDLSVFWSRYDALRRFLGFEPRELQHELRIVTTNYDLNAECALRHLSMYAHPGFPAPAGNFYQEVGVPVYKLHGSVNWFAASKDGGKLDVDQDIVEVRSRVGQEFVTGPVPAVCATNYANDRAPLLVAPSFLKPPLNKTMSDIWRGAAEALGEAHLVVFVGYSFPPSDTVMRYYLASALTRNAVLQRIVVVDPQADSIVIKLKDSASGYGSHFRDLLVADSHSWIKTGIDLDL